MIKLERSTVSTRTINRLVVISIGSKSPLRQSSPMASPGLFLYWAWIRRTAVRRSSVFADDDVGLACPSSRARTAEKGRLRCWTEVDNGSMQLTPRGLLWVVPLVGVASDGLVVGVAVTWDRPPTIDSVTRKYSVTTNVNENPGKLWTHQMRTEI